MVHLIQQIIDLRAMSATPLTKNDDCSEEAIIAAADWMEEQKKAAVKSPTKSPIKKKRKKSEGGAANPTGGDGDGANTSKKCSIFSVSALLIRASDRAFTVPISWIRFSHRWVFSCFFISSF